jgi:hypothetical protein
MRLRRRTTTEKHNAQAREKCFHTSDVINEISDRYLWKLHTVKLAPTSLGAVIDYFSDHIEPFDVHAGSISSEPTSHPLLELRNAHPVAVPLIPNELMV